MKRYSLLLLVSVAALMMGACTAEQAAPPRAENPETDSALVGAGATPFCVVAPQSRSRLDEAAGTALAGVTDVGLGVMRAKWEAGTSMVFSPLSLGYALGMVGLACDGVALQELNALLGLDPADRTTLPDLCATLTAALPEADREVALNLANAFYLNAARQDVELNADFRTALLAAFGADCEALDFRTPEALAHINNWCALHTNGFIPKVMEKLKQDANSYLLNALYFKAKWTTPFLTDLTRDADFTLEDGTKKTCKMMSQYEAENLPYAEADTYRAAALPYATGRYSMTVLLPKAGTTVADILGGLTAQKMRDLSATMEAGKRLLLFEMPKFETRVNINLVETLNEMGLPSWFSDCNIRGMVQDPDGTPHGVFVSNMFQVARINVSEEGTEAAAVTVVETYDGMSPGEPVVFRADHPFVYFISEKDTGAVLFVGTFEGDDAEAGDIETGIRDLKL